MKRELQRIEPKSVLRIAFFLGLVCGFLFGLYSGWVMKELSGTLLSAEETAALGVASESIFMSGILMALAGALFFSIGGGGLAALYNFLAGRFGGIEYVVAEDESEPDETSRDLSDYTND